MKLVSFFLSLFLLGCSLSQPSYVSSTDEELSSGLLLRVSVTQEKFKYADSDCSDGGCLSFWWEYEAKILEVVRGKYASDIIKFSIAQTAAFRKEATKDWYILVKESSGKNPPNYNVIDHALSGDTHKIRELLNGT